MGASNTRSRGTAVRRRMTWQTVFRVVPFFLLVGISPPVAHLSNVRAESGLPVPLLTKAQAVDWWFVFKFNAESRPGCSVGAKSHCLFGGEVQDYSRFSQQFLYASKGVPLKEGKGCLGDTTIDPVGATFDGTYYYVIWNDQFYNDPDLDLPQCKNSPYCPAPWAHSKGMIAWNDDGGGFVMQVSTPNWPGAGTAQHPRQQNGNTLGCLTKDVADEQNNILHSQHFFALRLTKADVLTVLKALRHISVVTAHEPSHGDHQVVNNGGPPDIAAAVNELGTLSNSSGYLDARLSSNVRLIAKSPNLVVPPWQMVSAALSQESLKVATWYSTDKIPDTVGGKKPGCWDPSLEAPGSVINVLNGHWAQPRSSSSGARITPS